VGRRGERGSATVELAVAAPAVLALVGLVVLAGRVETAHQVVAQAAEDAARAATLARSTPAMSDEARSAAAADLGGRDCGAFTVSVSGSLAPGSVLSARVTCTTGLGILPGTFTATGTGSAVVDIFRGVAK
jgi:Flp pilus assembly protein TadG